MSAIAHMAWGPPSQLPDGGFGAAASKEERHAHIELHARRGGEDGKEARAGATQTMRISTIATLRTRRWQNPTPPHSRAAGRSSTGHNLLPQVTSLCRSLFFLRGTAPPPPPLPISMRLELDLGGEESSSRRMVAACRGPLVVGRPG